MKSYPHIPSFKFISFVKESFLCKTSSKIPSKAKWFSTDISVEKDGAVF